MKKEKTKMWTCQRLPNICVENFQSFFHPQQRMQIKPRQKTTNIKRKQNKAYEATGVAQKEWNSRKAREGDVSWTKNAHVDKTLKE